MQKLLQYIKGHKIISAIAALLIIFIGYRWYQSAHTSAAPVQYITQPAQNTTITVAVSGSGQISEQNKIDLKPATSGALTSVNVVQGQSVKAGQVIAVVDEKSNLLSLNQAKAQLATAQANYDKLLAGDDPNDLHLAQISINTAQQNLDNAKANLENVTKQQQLAVDSAYQNLLNDSLTAVPASTNTSTGSVTLSGEYSGTDQGQYTIKIVATGSGYSFEVSGLEVGQDTTISRGVPLALGTRGLFVTFGTSGTFNMNDSWTVSIPNTAATNYLSLNDSYQTALQNQTQALQTAQQQIASDQNALDQAETTLAQKQESPNNADIESAKASIATAETQVEAAQNAYDNNMLTAPFDGIVAQLNNQRGDQVDSSTVVATIITNQQLAQIPLNEVDVSKIKVGQKAILTFDAISDLNLTGEVAQVDTIGTVSQGVVTYNVKIGLDTQDDRVKPGMTVNADIITDVAADVLAVPNSAVKTNGNSSYVQVLGPNGQPQNITVQTGIANDTLTEIKSGLSEGQQVISQTINPNSKTNTSSSSSGSAFRIGGFGGLGGGGGGGARPTIVGGGAGRGN